MDSPAHIVDLEQDALRLRLMLWTEAARWRVAWQLATGGPWHALARRFASEEGAREQAVAGAASYLRHGRRHATRSGRGYPPDARAGARVLASELRARSSAPVSAQALRAASADAAPNAVDDTLFERALKLAFPQARRHR